MGLAERAAASLNLVAGAWAALVVWTSRSGCPSGGCPASLLQSLLPWIGVLLVLDSIACFVGFRLAFPVGGLFSVAIAAIAGITLFDSGGLTIGVYASLALLSLVALLLDLIAMRSKRGLSEQGNPMNLPVFG